MQILFSFFFFKSSISFIPSLILLKADFPCFKNISPNSVRFISRPSLLIKVTPNSSIIITANTEINGALASSNMELMTNALNLGTFFSGFIQLAAKDNKEILELLKIKDKKIIACLVLGYPDVTYKRTTPRKDADITWI